MVRKIATIASAIVLIGMTTMAAPASADTWVTHQKFVSGTNTCKNSRTYDYTYTLKGGQLEVRNENGHMTTVTVPQNGQVNKDFKSSSGNLLNVSGNALTRDLYITATQFGCRWATAPKDASVQQATDRK